MSPATPRPWVALVELIKALLVLVIVVLATRAWLFGNPIIGIDEQFYLLVGDRLREGALPYVDIWDRKPLGLFLIYAAAGALFGDPVAGHQVLAALSAVLTGAVLFGIARRIVSFRAALAGASAYVAWLPVFAGVGGQSPVFYNLPMSLCATMLIHMLRINDASLIWRGPVIMLLAGIALQIKYTTVFEGVFFGLTLLWLGWRQGWSLIRLGISAGLWIGCALLPTVAAFAAYAATGHWWAFYQANFQSIFGDMNSPFNAVLRLIGLNVGLAPFWICLWLVWRGRSHLPEQNWILAWTGASLAGFLLFGVYYDHYILPLLLPLCLVAAMAIDRLPRWRLAILLVVGLGLLGGIGRSAADRLHYGSGAEAKAFAAKIKPHLGQGCLYVNEELPILYWLTKSCLPTRFAFPEHLVLYRYEHALGVDQLGELDRIFASRPAVVVKSTVPDDDTRVASRALLDARLRLDYQLVGDATVGAIRYEIHTRIKPVSPEGRTAARY